MHTEDATEHPAGSANVTGRNRTSYRGAGYFEVVHAYGIVHMYAEAELFAECAEFADSGLCAVTEAKVRALVNATNTQAAYQNAANKIVSGDTGEFGVEGQHEDSVHTGAGHQFDSL